MASLDGVRILTVDDEPEALEFLSEFLQQQGAEVKCVASGAEGLAEVAGFAPHIVVTDLSMPGMDGIEFLERLRRLGGAMPAVAISAMSDPEWKRRALQAGFHSFVQKPVELQQLLATITRFTGR
jgi:CheY-like chemotaxis protein